MQNLKTTIPEIILLFFLLLLVPGRSAQAGEFMLFYANDVRGEMEPCG